MRNKQYLFKGNELLYILVGSMTGVGILSLPNDMVKAAAQDGWIAALIGGIYPLLVVTATGFLHKSFPKENILELSEYIFGKIFGKILNTLFMIYLFIVVCSVSAGVSNVVIVFVLAYARNLKIILFTIFFSMYASYKGLNTLGKLNKITFYLTIFLMLIPIAAFQQNLFFNLQPMFAAKPIELVKGAYNSIFSYFGIELILILYPYVSSEVNIKKQGYFAVLINMLFYSWITLITIYYLGINIIPKNIWSFVIVTESFVVSTINTFRFVFMYFWVIILFKTIANIYYGLSYAVNSTFKIDRQTACILFFPLAAIFSLWFGNEVNRRGIMGVITPYMLIFNIVYILLVTAAVWIRRKKV